LKILRGLVALSLFAAVFCSGASNASPATDRFASDADSVLKSAAVQGFGGALIVRHQGKVILSHGYGLANRGRKIPFTVSTIAQIGSLTKIFTAIAVLQLAKGEKVDLNAPLSHYIGEAPPTIANATIEQLLVHRSGLARDCGQDFDPLSKAELFSKCTAQPLAFSAGEFHYSNVGYAVLAAVVEAASGQSWPDYVRDHILRPVGMASAGYRFDRPDSGDLAYGYLMGKEAPPIAASLKRLGDRDWHLEGNGGIEASTLDMDRFVQALIVDPRSPLQPVRAEMLTPGPRNQDGRTAEGYGLYFRFARDGSVLRLGGSGSDGTFFSYLIYYPKTATSLYVVGNSGEAVVRHVIGQVVRLLEQDLSLEPVHP
jgi:CubicO group peptidase (beta-lactamase class C family)